MANVKITELTAATALAGTDVLPIVDVGADATKKVSVSDLLRNLPDGTASAPALAFADDQNTGVLSPGNNSLAFATSGTQRLVIDSSGNCGIGTASPSANLHISSTGDTIARVTSADGNAAFLDLGDASDPDGGRIVYDSGSNLTFSTASTERLRIDSSGRLLVGTSSQSNSALLTVEGNTGNNSGAGELTLQRGEAATSITANESIGHIYFQDNSNKKFAEIACFADAAAGSNDYPGRILFSTTADGASSPTERIRLDNVGRANFFSGGNVIGAKTDDAAGTSTRLFFGSHSATGTVVGGTISFTVFSNGNVQNTNNSYGAISDAKLKENIVDASSQWNDIKDIRVRNYNFIEGQTHTQLGVVAQEVETVSPGLVSESPDIDNDGNDLGTTTKSVNYSVLYMKAVKALQEAMDRIETLETKVAALEAE